jgi:hypothetical protein
VFIRVHNWWFCYIKIRFIIIFLYMPRFSWFILPFRFPDQNVVCISHLCFMPLQSHPLGFINVIFGEAYNKMWSSSLYNFLHPFIIFSILGRKIILNICSGKFCNHLRYSNIYGSTESSKSIVYILKLCFIKMYLFYCRIILLFCQYRKLYHVIYVWMMNQKGFGMNRL